MYYSRTSQFSMSNEGQKDGLRAPMTFTIMITTHNRCADLRRTCAALTALSPPPEEVLICADGCTDDTVSMLVREFPGFIVLENQRRQGSVAARDRMLRLASADIVISLDDDSYPIDRDFLARVDQVLAEHPEAAVISFAEIRDEDCRGPPPTYSRSMPRPLRRGVCQLRRRHASRRLSAGSPAFQGSSATCTRSRITPCNVTRRASRSGSSRIWSCAITCRASIATQGRRQRLHARNELWSVLIRCPWPYLPAVALFRIWRQLRYAATQGLSDVLLQPAGGCPPCVACRNASRAAPRYHGGHTGVDEARRGTRSIGASSSLPDRDRVMRFHALLPVRDEADIVGQCLRHLLNWADAVYVFDTGSADDTWDIVRDVASTDTRVRLLGREPVYFSETRLRGWMFHQARATCGTATGSCASMPTSSTTSRRLSSCGRACAPTRPSCSTSITTSA